MQMIGRGNAVIAFDNPEKQVCSVVSNYSRVLYAGGGVHVSLQEL